jgi:actin-related protein
VLLSSQYLLSRKVDSDGQLVISGLSYPQTHPSYHALMLNEVYRDMKESLCRLGESAFDSSQKFPTVTYELPDGNAIEVGNERFIVPEHIFNPKYSGLLEVRGWVGDERTVNRDCLLSSRLTAVVPSFVVRVLQLKHDFDGFVYKGLHHMVLDSVESIDVDLRKDLYGNVVLSGGNTLFPGTPNRLTKEVGGIVAQ